MKEKGLRRFAGFEPLVHPDHYGKIGGRLRTSQGGGNTLRFYQFQLVSECKGGNCRLLMTPDGLENFTKSLATELGRDNIRANIICPGTVRTPAWNRRVEKDPHDLLIRLGAGPGRT